MTQHVTSGSLNTCHLPSLRTEPSLYICSKLIDSLPPQFPKPDPHPADYRNPIAHSFLQWSCSSRGCPLGAGDTFQPYSRGAKCMASVSRRLGSNVLLSRCTNVGGKRDGTRQRLLVLYEVWPGLPNTSCGPPYMFHPSIYHSFLSINQSINLASFLLSILLPIYPSIIFPSFFIHLFLSSFCPSIPQKHMDQLFCSQHCIGL